MMVVICRQKQLHMQRPCLVGENESDQTDLEISVGVLVF